MAHWTFALALLAVASAVAAERRGEEKSRPPPPPRTASVRVMRGGAVDLGASLADLLMEGLDNDDEDDYGGGGAAAKETPATTERRRSESGPCTARAVRGGAYLLAGSVVPETFSCSGMPEARYLHSGTPLLDSDMIKLSAFRSVGNYTIVDVVVIHVSVVEQIEPLVRLGDVDITVTEFMGRTQPFAAENVRFAVDPDAGNCFVRYSRAAAGGWPLVGQPLVWRHSGGGDGGGSYEAVADGFELPCRQLVDNESLAYEHLSPPSPDVDYMPLEVQATATVTPAARFRGGGARTNLLRQQNSLLTRARATSASSGGGGGDRDAVVVQRFYLPIHVKGGLPNRPPKAAFVGAYVMDVDEFALTTVISDVLSATDTETPAGQLVFNISKPPEAGHFVHLSDHTEPITSFRQEDMDDGLIAYWPPERSYPTKMIYEVEFRVHDSHFAFSSPIVLHIAVRPSASKGLRVAINVAVNVLEGTAVAIDRLHLRIVGTNKPANIRLYVAGGLRHGRLEFSGERSPKWFTQEDIDAGRIRYVHDDSDSARDHIDLRIAEGRKESVRTRFFIDIVPLDDTAPTIVRNLEVRLLEGETIRISSVFLLATDEDTHTDKIRYIITRPPLGGELLRRINPREGGVVVKSFTNRDVIRGYIYYKHLGGELHEDSFEFTLSDDAEPGVTNLSPGHVFRLQITPVDDTPPEPASDASRSASVPETDILVISQSILHYTDRDETNDDDILYNVTVAPQFADGGRESDAGKVVSVRGVHTFTKDSTLQPIYAFSQRDIKYGFVAYIPPSTDIGLWPRLVKFWVAASDKSQNVAIPAEVNITIMPIDNQPPVVSVSRVLTVREDRSASLSDAGFSISDKDSALTQLRITLMKAPGLGYLSSKDKATLTEGEHFSVEDILSGNVRYSHGGNESAASDEFELSISDGSQASRVLCTVSILLADDERPSFAKGLATELSVPEGSFVLLSSENIAATDKDTNDASLEFQVQSSGLHGSLYLDNQTTISRFTQQDVLSRRISYGVLNEIGRQPVQDTIVISVKEASRASAQPARLSPLSADSPSPGDITQQLTFRVQPVDNQSPTLPKSFVSIGVKESGEVRVTLDLFSVGDPDTDLQALSFVLLQQPRWGFFENKGFGPGSEISMKGKPQAAFSWQQVEAGLIHYVQSIHAGVEPKEDSALLYVTDGANNSSAVTVLLHIIGINDEAPTIHAMNFSVVEGKEVAIENVTVADLDSPSDPLRLSVSHLPKYGQLSLTLHAADGRGRQSTHQLPVKSYFDPADLGGAIRLIYKHDGSEKFSDHITLQAFDGTHRTEVRVEVSIRPQNDAPPAVVRNAGALLYYNETVVLSRLMLSAQDEDSSDGDIVYILTRLPNRGYLEVNQRDDREGERGDSMKWRRLVVRDKFSQDDINRGRVRYTSHHVSTADKTADMFEFLISDGITTRAKETFEIEVRKSKALPDIRVTSESPLQVSYGAGTALTTREVSAYDASDMHASLVYTVSREPRHGRLEKIDSARRVATSAEPRDTSLIVHDRTISFSQIDLASGKIWYMHCGCDNATSDSIELVVQSSSRSGTAKRQTAFILDVRISPVSLDLPIIDVNESILMRPGGLLNLADVLRVSTPGGRRRNVTVSVVSPLRYGKVMVNERSVPLFSVDDLISRRAYYMRTSHQNQSEKLVLLLSSDSSQVHEYRGRITNYTTVTIGVDGASGPSSSSLCSDVGLHSPQALDTVAAGRQGFVITNNNILLPKQCDASAAAFIIKATPQFGALMKADKSALGSGTKFSHRDLSRGILYVMGNFTGSNWNDSIVFSLSIDGQQQRLPHRLSFIWSVVSFATTNTTVCENEGHLSVRILRTGSLSGVAFVSIVGTELTAKVDDDFTLDRHRQLQFEPDTNERTFKIILKLDDVTEHTESFRLSLSSPVNAVLGNAAHMTVFIEDRLSMSADRCAAGRGRRHGAHSPRRDTAHRSSQMRVRREASQLLSHPPHRHVATLWSGA